MKLKYYLRGAGIGIVFATLIMLIVCSGNNNNNLTDDEIIQKALNLGMIMPDTEEDSESLLPKESQKENSQSQSPVIDNPTSEQVEPPVSDAPTTETPSTQATDAQTPAPDTPVAENPEPSSVTIHVVPEMIAQDVVNALYENGLIADAENFRKYMWSTGIADELEIGAYEIPIGATEDQIIEIFRAGNGEN